MRRSGIAFGAHTLTHPDLTRLPTELLETEVVDGKRVIEDALGSRVERFAYPFGRYDKRCRELVSRQFLCACSDKLGLVRPSSDTYAVERVDTYYLQSERLLTSIFATWFPYYVWTPACRAKSDALLCNAHQEFREYLAAETHRWLVIRDAEEKG